MPAMWSIGRIKARHSGKSLDVSGASIDGGARIIQNHEIDGRASQLWLFEPVQNSTPFRIVNQHSRKVLQVVDLHGEALPLTQEAKQLGDARQLFTFRDHSQKNFFLSPILRIFDDPVLDVHGGSVEDGAGVIVFPRKPEASTTSCGNSSPNPTGAHHKSSDYVCAVGLVPLVNRRAASFWVSPSVGELSARDRSVGTRRSNTSSPRLDSLEPLPRR